MLLLYLPREGPGWQFQQQCGLNCAFNLRLESFCRSKKRVYIYGWQRNHPNLNFKMVQTAASFEQYHWHGCSLAKLLMSFLENFYYYLQWHKILAGQNRFGGLIDELNWQHLPGKENLPFSPAAKLLDRVLPTSSCPFIPFPHEGFLLFLWWCLCGLKKCSR